MNYYIKVENNTPVGKPYPYPVEGGVPLHVVKPLFDHKFEQLIAGAYVFDPVGVKVDKVYAKDWKPFPVVVQEIQTRLDDVRRTTLDKFQKKSVGISRVYAENLRVAEMFVAGDTSLLSTGGTAESYLTTLGSPIGMNATEFAQYIISENQRLTPNALEVEKRYLQVKASFMSGSVAAVSAAWYNFYDYCLTVVTE